MPIMPEIVGVAFPVPKSYIKRFFEDGKNVFIKPAITFKELREGMRFIFYQSREDTGYVGDAIIKQICISEDPISFFEIYGSDIFITEDEVKTYIEKTKKWKTIRKRRKSKPRNSRWLAIKLESIHKYEAPIKPKHFLPVGGQYITDDILYKFLDLKQ